jgi:hypothetical protein
VVIYENGMIHFNLPRVTSRNQTVKMGRPKQVKGKAVVKKQPSTAKKVTNTGVSAVASLQTAPFCPPLADLMDPDLYTHTHTHIY